MDGRSANIATNCLIAYVLICATSSPHEVQTLARLACSDPTQSQNAGIEKQGKGEVRGLLLLTLGVRTV